MGSHEDRRQITYSWAVSMGMTRMRPHTAMMTRLHPIMLTQTKSAIDGDIPRACSPSAYSAISGRFQKPSMSRILLVEKASVHEEEWLCTNDVVYCALHAGRDVVQCHALAKTHDANQQQCDCDAQCQDKCERVCNAVENVATASPHLARMTDAREKEERSRTHCEAEADPREDAREALLP